MAPAPTLQALIAVVEADAGAPDPIDRLAVAAVTVSELGDVADALLDHFVEECRREGRSWTEISGALGVTRQAAHKRFTTAPATLERFTPRAKAVLSAASDEARGMGHNFVGTEHLLLGLFAQPEGVAARVLTDFGATRERVETQVLTLLPRIPHMVAAAPPYTPRVKRCLEQAVIEALGLGHNYIGTEHLLLALFADDTSIAAKVLRELAVDRDRCRAAIVAILSGLTKT